ncbi:hypothetical protein [Lactiplantibacillus plantarum]|uniref:hypothetical protein n=2 Tax=Lactiplantibacillus plantarum TaxID=1590 RepID=UPI0022E90444|nr:hypothetical protein [Lactiplantibacillus plantarum]
MFASAEKERPLIMDNQLPYKEQQDCILYGIARITSIDPQELTPELQLIGDNMAMAFYLNVLMLNRGLK